ncbi:MAG: aminotransferase class I/II-fold pyridoxal phosphate-dependent enzyme [Kiritimatiellia bacterium]
MRPLRERIARQIVDMPKSGIREFFDIVSTRKDVISLGVGEPDFDTPWRMREQAMFSLERGETHYTANRGLLELRRAIATYVRSNFGAEYNPDKEIIVTAGVSEAMDIALRAILDPGDEVIYHEPCFVSYAPVIRMAHGVPVPVETSRDGSFRLTPELIEAKLTPRTKAILLNYPNNPTGATLSKQEVEAIAALVIKHDLLIISDEIYAELTYDHPHASFLSVPGMRERTIFLHGFSKAWAMTGFRLGYVCAPAELSDAMVKIHQYIMMCASTNAQRAALEGLNHGLDDMHRMIEHYSRRRNFVHASFLDMGLPMHKPAGAFYAFPRIAGLGLDSRQFALDLLNRHQVAVVPGTAFGPSGEGYIRCSYATSMDNLKLAMDRIAAFVCELRAQA